MTDPTIPHNADAERGLIGLAIVRESVPQGARSLATTDFYLDVYRDAWSAFLELEEDLQPVDAISAVQIIKRNRPGSATTVGELMQMASGVPNCNEKVFVDEIKRASTQRFLIRKLSSGIASLQSGEKGVINDLRRELNALEYAEENKGAFVRLRDVIEKEFFPALKNLRDGVTHKISTGFDAIDNVIGGGLSLSDILLIAAMPGAGKSALVLKIATNIAKQDIPVAFLAGEMSDLENTMRLVSQSAQTHNLNSFHHLSDEEYNFYYEWGEALKDLPIYMDSHTSDLRTLSLSLRSMVEDHGIKVLFIDYIQLLKLDRQSKLTRTERISECSQEVKRIAMEYGIAVVEVAQFNREGIKSGKPTMSDLEGSSQLEKDASLIFLLDTEENSKDVGLRIVKGRNTGKNEIKGTFEGWKLEFNFV